MEPLFKLQSFQERDLNKSKIYCFLMLPHFLKVLRLQEVWWLIWSQETPQSQQRNHRLSQHMQTINQKYQSKSLKERDSWLRIIISLVSSILVELLLPREEFQRLKSHSILMLMEFSMYLLLTWQATNLRRSPSPMIQDVFQRKRLRRWCKMPRSLRLRMN